MQKPGLPDQIPNCSRAQARNVRVFHKNFTNVKFSLKTPPRNIKTTLKEGKQGKKHGILEKSQNLFRTLLFMKSSCQGQKVYKSMNFVHDLATLAKTIVVIAPDHMGRKSEVPTVLKCNLFVIDLSEVVIAQFFLFCLKTV